MPITAQSSVEYNYLREKSQEDRAKWMAVKIDSCDIMGLVISRYTKTLSLYLRAEFEAEDWLNRTRQPTDDEILAMRFDDWFKDEGDSDDLLPKHGSSHLDYLYKLTVIRDSECK